MISKKFILLSVLLGVFIAFNASAQESSQITIPAKSKGRPDIPGTFHLEFGFNQPMNKPDSAFEIGFWGSRTMNIYYTYDMRILKSKFSFHPGIGFGLERFKFSNNYTLEYNNDTRDVSLVSATSTYPGIRKSMLVMNYIDVPLELRFSTRPEDPSRSFHISVGGRVGYLFDAFTKIKYTEDGDSKKVKDNQNFNLNRFRYGLLFKVGGGNFSLFSYYNLSTVFEKDGSPVSTDMNNFTVGISLSSF